MNLRLQTIATHCALTVNTGKGGILTLGETRTTLKDFVTVASSFFLKCCLLYCMLLDDQPVVGKTILKHEPALGPIVSTSRL